MTNDPDLVLKSHESPWPETPTIWLRMGLGRREG